MTAAASIALPVCRARSEGGRRCDTHLKTLAAAQLLPPPRPDLPPPSWAGEINQKPAQLYTELPRQVANAALNTYLQALRHEPQMTDHLTAVISTQAGAQLAGLQHRLKSPSSLARKIETASYLMLLTPEQAGTAVADIIRYTVTTTRVSDLIPALTAVVDELGAQGWTVDIAKHSFVKGNPYKGIHLIMTGVGGQRCEIQFHTAAALAIKEQTHRDYEIYRDLNKTPRQRSAAFDRCVGRWAKIPTPPGLRTLTTLGGATVAANDYRPKRPPLSRKEKES